MKTKRWGKGTSYFIVCVCVIEMREDMGELSSCGGEKKAKQSNDYVIGNQESRIHPSHQNGTYL